MKMIMQFSAKERPFSSLDAVLPLLLVSQPSSRVSNPHFYQPENTGTLKKKMNSESVEGNNENLKITGRSEKPAELSVVLL